VVAPAAAPSATCSPAAVPLQREVTQTVLPTSLFICERMLMRRTGIRLTYMAFDLLTLDGQDLRGAPYGHRAD
jgi:hypothetical protein